MQACILPVKGEQKQKARSYSSVAGFRMTLTPEWPIKRRKVHPLHNFAR